MNGSILILGAGSFGQTLAETAMACGYSRISFLDDESPMAVGKLREAERFLADYPEAIVAIGSSALRERLQRQLREWGFCLPVLMHPTAYISPTAQLGEGCFLGPKAVVNTGACVGQGCILSVGAIVDHHARIGDWCQINTGSIVKAGAVVPPHTKLEAGEVVLGYSQAVVKRP